MLLARDGRGHYRQCLQSFTLWTLTGHHQEIGGDRVFYGTGGAAVQTLDIDSQEYRPSTLKDLADFTRLVDALPNVSWFTRCCVATDVPEIIDLDINTVYCLAKYTQKPVGTSITLGPHVHAIVDLFDMSPMAKASLRTAVLQGINPIISPMRYGEDALTSPWPVSNGYAN